MSTAQQLIEAAYARSTANDAGKLAGDGELLGHLNRKYQALYAIYASLSGDNAITKTAIVFAGGPPAAAPLPTDIIDIVRVEKADGSRAYLIPASEKDRSWHLAPAMFRQGNSLVSRNQAGDPIAADSYNLFHIDSPATLAALATAIDARFPVRFEDLLVLDLAVYLSVKDEGRNADRIRSVEAGASAGAGDVRHADAALQLGQGSAARIFGEEIVSNVLDVSRLRAALCSRLPLRA
jgi:hypothetical protein